jgi:hypothetical protein
VIAVTVFLLLAAIVPAANRYGAMDASGDGRGRQYLEAVFAALEPDAVIISWWSLSTPLWYGRWVEGRREDITIIDDRDIIDDGYGDVAGAIDRFLGQRPVYVVRLDRDLQAIADAYMLEAVAGVPARLYRVVGAKQEESGRDP